MADWAPFLTWEGLRGSVDKIGMEMLEANYYVPTLAEARYWLPGDLESQTRLIFKHRQYAQEWGNSKLIEAGKDGAYKLTLTMEGVGDPTRDFDAYTFEGDGDVSEDPAESHPHLEMLMKKYDGSIEDNKLVFAQTISQGGSPVETSVGSDFQASLYSTALRHDPNASQISNPLFGFKKYKVPGLKWVVTFLSRVPPPSLTDRLGKLGTPIAGPGGYIPSLPGNRRWLQHIGKPVWRGNIWRCTKGWWAGNWNSDVYR